MMKRFLVCAAVFLLTIASANASTFNLFMTGRASTSNAPLKPGEGSLFTTSIVDNKVNMYWDADVAYGNTTNLIEGLPNYSDDTSITDVIFLPRMTYSNDPNHEFIYINSGDQNFSFGYGTSYPEEQFDAIFKITNTVYSRGTYNISDLGLQFIAGGVSYATGPKDITNYTFTPTAFDISGQIIIHTVPIPSSLPLLGLAMVFLGISSRYLRRANQLR